MVAFIHILRIVVGPKITNRSIGYTSPATLHKNVAYTFLGTEVESRVLCSPRRVKAPLTQRKILPFAFSFARSLTVMRYELCMS